MAIETALLVVSCDRYRDLWVPFFTLLFRYWPDCPYPVFLGSNNETFPDRRVIPLAVGTDIDWSTNLRRMLDGIPVDGILLLQEDFLIDRPVETERIRGLIGYAAAKDAACLRLMPIPGPDQPCADHPEIGEIRKGAAYRVSLQAAWWRKESLAAVLAAGESPWQFERLGSRRSDDLAAPFLSLREGVDFPLDYYTTAVFRGYWEPEAVALCRREHIPVDLRARAVMPLGMRVERTLRTWGIPDRAARWLALPFRARARALRAGTSPESSGSVRK
ncbi:MAG: hypothetical protein WBM17_03310 [Anaerolineales bacterium]